MDVDTYFSIKRNITNDCNNGRCWDSGFTCPLSMSNNGKGVRCSVLEQDYPEVAEEILYEAIRKKFPNGYIICAIDRKFGDINKCNKYESCTECRNADK
jgi:hypothetical protein